MSRWCALLVVVALSSACGGADTSASTTQTTQLSTTSAPAVTTTLATTTTTTEPPQTVDAPELAGTSWTVSDYTLPSGTMTNVWKTDVTIAFGADGTLSGSAGCNDYSGTWTVSGAYDQFEEGVPDPNDGQVLVLGDLSWTEKACEDADVMQQEGEILDLLQRAGRWVLIRGNFHLRDADGKFLFEAEPAA